ncbi:MAG: FHA domain-containing protein [Synergistaceae bacterium]|nr:FHA domain-containing protein [Synergistaceae bacterium]
MELIKICPACGEENPIWEVICRLCMTNIASVSPSCPARGPAPAESEGSDLAASPPGTLTLARASDGQALTLQSGATLGRSGETGEFFKDRRTVSRAHARVCLEGGIWQIEDLGSLNGTWVNGTRIEPGHAHPIASGDTLALSLACELRVIS